MKPIRWPFVFPSSLGVCNPLEHLTGIGCCGAIIFKSFKLPFSVKKEHYRYLYSMIMDKMIDEAYTLQRNTILMTDTWKGELNYIQHGVSMLHNATLKDVLRENAHVSDEEWDSFPTIFGMLQYFGIPFTYGGINTKTSRPIVSYTISISEWRDTIYRKIKKDKIDMDEKLKRTQEEPEKVEPVTEKVEPRKVISRNLDSLLESHIAGHVGLGAQLLGTLSTPDNREILYPPQYNQLTQQYDQEYDRYLSASQYGLIHRPLRVKLK